MDFKQFQEAINKLGSHRFEAILQNVINDLGAEFLKVVETEFRSLHMINSEKTIESFHKDNKKNVWKFKFNKGRQTFSLEVGSKYHVAFFIDKGYEIKKPHFVPGHFEGTKFIYDKRGRRRRRRKDGTKPTGKKQLQGIIFKPRTFAGKHYMDAAVEGFGVDMKKVIENALQKELDKVI